MLDSSTAVETLVQTESEPDSLALAPQTLETQDTFTAPRVALLMLVALLPFWAIPAAHVLSSTETATGFFHYELPYYVANGRAVFERGNGVFYPNPYDPSQDSPSIYVHWLPWILGLATAVAGFDPGDTILALTFFGSLAFAWSTWRIVAERTDASKTSSIAFLLSMWGGGILAVAGIVIGLFGERPLLDSALQFDPGNGLWFLNWGRNALFPTEAIYHTLVVCCWLCELRRKHVAANVWLLLLATTHPWSGLELLLTINLWRFVQFAGSIFAERRQSLVIFGTAKNAEQLVANQEILQAVTEEAGNKNITSVRSALNQLSISVIALVTFLGYYKVWLPSFSGHAELQEVWELNWSVTWTSAALAYLPVLIPAVVCLFGKRAIVGWTRTEQFLLCALVVATGLAFHDRLIKPVQPLHFTRGYVWMPLFLLGLPVTLGWLRALRPSSGRMGLAGLLLTVAFVADNAVFAIVHCNRQFNQQEGFYLDTHERALLLAVHENPSTRNRIAFSDSEDLNYLLPTFASVRTWAGHCFNTPDFLNRKNIWGSCFANSDVDVEKIPADVDVLLLRRTRSVEKLESNSDWQRVKIPNAEWQVWRRSNPHLDR